MKHFITFQAKIRVSIFLFIILINNIIFCQDTIINYHWQSIIKKPIIKVDTSNISFNNPIPSINKCFEYSSYFKKLRDKKLFEILYNSCKNTKSLNFSSKKVTKILKRVKRLGSFSICKFYIAQLLDSSFEKINFNYCSTLSETISKKRNNYCSNIEVKLFMLFIIDYFCYRDVVINLNNDDLDIKLENNSFIGRNCTNTEVNELIDIYIKYFKRTVRKRSKFSSKICLFNWKINKYKFAPLPYRNFSPPI